MAVQEPEILEEAQQPLEPKAVARLEKLTGVLIGIGITLFFLVAWKVLFNIAAWFAPALAILGVVAYLVAIAPFLPYLMQIAFKTVTWVSVALVIMASLSGGAFLPATFAEIISPPLAEFGGALALTITGVCLVLTEIFKRKPTFVFDIGLGCIFASRWVEAEIDRQIKTPNNPLALVDVNARLDTVLSYGLVFGVLSLVGIFLWYREARGGNPSLMRNVGDISRTTWRWAVLFATFGLAYALANNKPDWYKFALMLGGLAVLFVAVNFPLRFPTFLFSFLKSMGWVAIGLVVLVLGYILTTEDLEINFLKNTLEYRTQQFWRAGFGDERFVTKPTGFISGEVRGGGQPLENATVVVAPVNGQPYTAVTDKNGRYTIQNVPVGNYLPVATRSGYEFGGSFGNTGRAVTVGEGQTTKDVNFSLSPKPMFQLNTSDKFTLLPPENVKRDFPEPSEVRRRFFTFENRGKFLNGGVVHEPLDNKGQYPILLIIYPGEAIAWEGVSVPLAAKGFVVISYFPRRLLDFEGDVDDLNMLTSLVLRRKLTTSGDPNRIVVVGGSVSTLYVYQMLRQLEGSEYQKNVKAAIMYGGLINMFNYRNVWEKGGKIIIQRDDIAPLEGLLIAFGRPDTRPEMYTRFSPKFAHLPTSLPPMLLVHANQDEIVPVEQSFEAEEHFKKLGIPNQALYYPDLKHYLDLSQPDPSQQDMFNKTLAFLAKYV
jgi:Carboxypeptidase regulatory-like domain/Prolyl oligopeptidase family